MEEVVIGKAPLDPIVDPEGLDREGPATGRAPEAGDKAKEPGMVGPEALEVAVGIPGAMVVVDAVGVGAKGRDKGSAHVPITPQAFSSD